MTFTLAVPPGTPGQTVHDTKAREAQAAHDLAGQGHLLRLWALPGEGRALGLYRARDAAEMQAILKSLPLAPWMTVETTPLAAPERPGDHPSADGPATTGMRANRSSPDLIPKREPLRIANRAYRCHPSTRRRGKR